MTHERFQQFLQSPDLLSTIPYEELKTLAITYPYAANLQVLLLLKSAQEQHPDEERNRSTAAAYCLDRKLLFCLLNDLAVVPVPAVELEVLELKPLSALPARDERTAELQTEAALVVPLPPSPTPPEDTREKPMPEDAPVEGPSLQEEATGAADLTIVTEAPVLETARFSSFAEWANHFNPVLLTKKAPAAPTTPPPAAETPAPSPENPQKTPGIAQQLAQKSVSENPEIASETLARLYAQQGYRDKAIEMYQRLMVLHPEKSAFFAAQIEALTKNT
ncbi:MAG: hypothetical protein RMJ33_03110 [Saprospiraceae bacterium]|nr:hypothetical protein [Saprospiraceae bacterium]MDW8228806.1 hypothetical protein [Saprospiraceae bacterium]